MVKESKSVAKKLSKQEYNQIKKYLDLKVSKASITKLTGRSFPVIVNVGNSTNYEQYMEDKYNYKSRSIEVKDVDEEIKTMVFNLTNQVIAMNKKLDQALQEKAPF